MLRVAFGVLCVASAWCFAQEGATPDAARVDWLRSVAAPIVTDEAGHGFEDLRPLKAMIGDARIVSLGEPTHGTRECFQFKHRLVEFLASEMGFTIFSIEANMPEAIRLTDYVLRGEGDPRGLIKGMYFWTWDTEEVLAMVEWMREFNAREREKGSGKQIIFTGFDMQTHRVAADLAKAFVAKSDDAYLPVLTEHYSIVERAIAGTQAPSANAIVVGSFPVERVRGKRITFSGAIRTAGLNGFAGLWWRVDGPGGEVLAFDNMNSRQIKGDTDWGRHEIELDVPEEAVGIAFGVLMIGKGTAWFDALSIDYGGATFRDPDAFDMEFEGERLKGFTLTTPRARLAFDPVNPHAGEKSLRLSTEGPGSSKEVTMAEARAAADAVLAHLEANEVNYRATLPAREVAEGVQNARVVAQCVRSLVMSAMDLKDEALWIRLADELGRDRFMADNAAWLLDQNPGAKIVLWAHNGHVGRRPGAMGHYLDQRFGKEQIVIGFATGTGGYTAIGNAGLGEHVLETPPPSSMEWYLTATGLPRAVFDLRRAEEAPDAAAWLTTRIPIKMIGAVAMERQHFAQPVTSMFDLLVWQQETTPARSLWQVVPKRR